MAFCTNCGKPIDPNAAFCTGCGKALKTEVTAPVAETPAVEEVPVAETAPVAETPVAEDAPKTFCTQCGAPLSPGATFCTSCGKAVNDAPRAAASFGPSKINVKLLAIIGAGVAVAVGVIILLVCLLSGGKAGSYEEAVDMYMERMIALEFSASEVEDAVPEAVLDRIDGGAEALSEELSRKYSSGQAMMQLAEIDWMIADAEKLSKDELEELIEDEDLDEFYMKITAGYEVKIAISISYMGMSETENETYCALEIDGDWYLYDETFEAAVDMADY